MLSCTCGATMEVPTVLQMARLEQVSTEPPAAAPSVPWGLRQSMVLLGVLIALLGIGLTVGLFLTRPQLPDNDEVRRRATSYTAVQSWQYYREDLRIFGPDRPSKKHDEAFAKAAFRQNVWMGVTLTLAIAGVVLATLATLQRRPSHGNQHKAATVGRAATPEQPPDAT